jgi:hypothetical protein
MTEQTEKAFKVIITNRVESEKDLITGPGVHINPPPSDGRCQCCLKHISELKPYGEMGGEFKDAYLIKTFRPDALIDEKTVEEVEKAFAEAEAEYQKDKI